MTYSTLFTSLLIVAAFAHHSAYADSGPTVAGVLYSPAPMLLYLWVHQLPHVTLEPFVRTFFVGAHQPATSAARIAARRRTGGMSCPAVGALTNPSLKVALGLAGSKCVGLHRKGGNPRPTDAVGELGLTGGRANATPPQ